MITLELFDWSTYNLNSSLLWKGSAVKTMEKDVSKRPSLSFEVYFDSWYCRVYSCMFFIARRGWVGL